MSSDGQKSPSQARMLAAQLQSVPIFSQVSLENLEQLAQSAHLKSLRAGGELFQQGDPGDALYILSEGTARVVVQTASGFEVTVALRKAGSILGEQALLDGQPRSASIHAVTACRLWVLTRAVFLSYLRSSPEVALPLLIALSLRLREASERIQELAHTSVRYRLARLLCTLALHDGEKVDQAILLPPLAHENLGSLIGVKRETVTRCLAQFRSQGLVEQQGRRLYVTDLKRLEEAALALEEG